MTTETKTYTYTKGQKVQLDTIYDHCGLGGGDWWEADKEGDFYLGDGTDEDLVITSDITIKITVTR